MPCLLPPLTSQLRLPELQLALAIDPNKRSFYKFALLGPTRARERRPLSVRALTALTHCTHARPATGYSRKQCNLSH